MKLSDYFNEEVKGRYNRQEFIEKTGWSRQNLSRIERRKYSHLSVEDIKTIIRLTNNLVTIDDL